MSATTERVDSYSITGYSGGGSTGTGTVSGTNLGFNVKATSPSSSILGTGGATSFHTGSSAGTVSYTYVGTVTYTVGATAYQGFVGEDGSGHYLLFIPNGQVGPVTGTITIEGNNGGTGGGSTQWDMTSGAINCFVAGTMIATPTGDVPVESLTAGDLVLTADGQAMRVRWLGRSVVARAFSDPLQVLPVRIRAGALAENLPRRDLLVSPTHAVRVGDVLVQASALVNGTSVVREQGMLPVFTYYHLELDTHALVLAEGVPAESYLEGVEEIGFQNIDERQAPEAVQELSYPRVRAQRQLPVTVREQLAARAAVLAGELAEAA